MFLEYFVLRRVVLSYPFHEHSCVFFFLVHVVLKELLQRGSLGSIYPLLIEIYGFQFLSQRFSGSLQVNMLWVKLLQRLEKRHTCPPYISLFSHHSGPAFGTAHGVTRRALLVGHLFPTAGTDTVTTGASPGLVTSYPAAPFATSSGRPGSISSRHIYTSKKIWPFIFSPCLCHDPCQSGQVHWAGNWIGICLICSPEQHPAPCLQPR